MTPTAASNDAPNSSDRPPDLRVTRDAQGREWIEVSGVWNLRSLTPFLARLEASLKAYREAPAWDLSAVTALDHAGALLLWRTWGRRMADPVRLRPEHKIFFTHLAVPDAAQLPRSRREFFGPVLLAGRVEDGPRAIFGRDG